jgi:hypothetical protein
MDEIGHEQPLRLLVEIETRKKELFEQVFRGLDETLSFDEYYRSEALPRFWREICHVSDLPSEERQARTKVESSLLLDELISLHRRSCALVLELFRLLQKYALTFFEVEPRAAAKTALNPATHPYFEVNRFFSDTEAQEREQMQPFELAFYLHAAVPGGLELPTRNQIRATLMFPVAVEGTFSLLRKQDSEAHWRKDDVPCWIGATYSSDAHSDEYNHVLSLFSSLLQLAVHRSYKAAAATARYSDLFSMKLAEVQKLAEQPQEPAKCFADLVKIIHAADETLLPAHEHVTFHDKKIADDKFIQISIPDPHNVLVVGVGRVGRVDVSLFFPLWPL